MPWALIFGFLGNLPGVLGGYFKKKQEIEDKKLDNQLAIQLENTKLAAQVAQSQFELNKTIVAATGSYFKYFTFCIWFGPFVIGSYSKKYGADIFANWASMPEWYVNSIIAIMFTIWGIQVSAPAVANIFSSLADFFKDKRQDKIKLTVAKAGLNEKVLADQLRANLFTKGMTQEQWEAILKSTKNSIE